MAGERLDRAIPALAPAISRTRVKKLIEGGAVFVDKVRVRVCSRGVHPGQTLTCYELAAPPLVEPRIVHDAADLVIIDKPAGMAVEPTREGAAGALTEWLRQRKLEALTTHRLDAPTSGLVLLANSDEARAEINRMLVAHEIKRGYQAAVSPAPGWDSHTFDLALDEREARTHARVLARTADAALLAVELETGRTRQIRRHLASGGVPVVGDNARHPEAKRAPRPGNRLMLHAETLTLTWRGVAVSVRAEPPEDFVAGLKALGLAT